MKAKTLKQLIDEFHLATLIIIDQGHRFEDHEKNKLAFERELVDFFLELKKSN